jgi:hypothetical protein
VSTGLRTAIVAVTMHFVLYVSMAPVAVQTIRNDPWYGSAEGWYVSSSLAYGCFIAWMILFFVSPLPPFSSILVARCAAAAFRSKRWQRLHLKTRSLLLHVMLSWVTLLVGANLFLALNFSVSPDTTAGLGRALIGLLRPLYYPLYGIAMVSTGAFLLVLLYCAFLGSIVGFVMWRIRSGRSRSARVATNKDETASE